VAKVSKQPTPVENNRWWEAYLTRYLIGSIVGAVCLFAIIESESPIGCKIDHFIRYALNECSSCSISNIEKICLNNQIQSSAINNSTISPNYQISSKCDESTSKSPRLVLLLVLGFGYCYLVSAPLTLMHYLRSTLSQVDCLKGSNKNSARALRNLVPVSLIFYLFIPGSLLLSVKSHYSIFFGLSIVALVAVIEVTVRMSEAYRFYKKKAIIASSHKNWWSGELSSSYKHLSEHGNAYLIVIYEIVFAVALGTGGLSLIQGLWLIILWVFLGAICLVYAKQIELQMVHLTPGRLARIKPKSATPNSKQS